MMERGNGEKDHSLLPFLLLNFALTGIPIREAGHTSARKV